MGNATEADLLYVLMLLKTQLSSRKRGVRSPLFWLAAPQIQQHRHQRGWKQQGWGRTRRPVPQYLCFQPSRGKRRYPAMQIQHPQGSVGRKPGGLTRKPVYFPSWQHLLCGSRMKYEEAAGTGFLLPCSKVWISPTQSI